MCLICHSDLGEDFHHFSLSTRSELLFPSSFESNRIGEVAPLRVTATELWKETFGITLTKTYLYVQLQFDKYTANIWYKCKTSGDWGRKVEVMAHCGSVFFAPHWLRPAPQNCARMIHRTTFVFMKESDDEKPGA